MIEWGRGNLLTADTEAVVNTVNTVGVMGKGIALQFKRAFPDNFVAYKRACEAGEVAVGRILVHDTGSLGHGRYIFNLPTKRHWRSPSRLEDVEAGLEALVEVVDRLGVSSVAVPALGCGNGGLDWAVVRQLIERASARIPHVRMVVFPPHGAPAAQDMPNNTPRPIMNPLRSLLLVGLDAYLARARRLDPRDGVSELEIHKIVYLLNTLGATFPVTFVRGTYGPYSPGLPHVLDALEGHYLTGLGDRSARVQELTPIALLPGAIDEARRHVPRELLPLVDRLLALVDGFESPYSMELLATVHFAAWTAPPAGNPEAVATRVAEWNLRKAHLFTPHHVRVALERLAENDLLPRSPAPSTCGV